jgi:hypothetical protein
MSSELSEFEELNQESSTGTTRELWQFIVENKTWWMLPILFVFGMFGILIALSGTGMLPFVYTIF